MTPLSPTAFQSVSISSMSLTQLVGTARFKPTMPSPRLVLNVAAAAKIIDIATVSTFPGYAH